ncbi:MAG: homoserine O-succinyltransferase [Acidobacteria bacterium]|nr:homoserine O-succinyltransferase [Acidobacteriota bacterium]
MILVLNLLIDPSLSESFDRAIKARLLKEKKEGYIIDYDNLDTFNPDSQYSHLIVGGSEASVLDDKEWYDPLKKIIDHFAEKNKPILGICFGHQFLVRCLAGKEYVKKSTTPEFGWGEIFVDRDNPLFNGIDKLTSCLSHFDEVSALPENYQVLAHSNGCEIQAFQVGEKLIWGIQFHPEYDKEGAEEIFQSVRDFFPAVSDLINDNLPEDFLLDNNRLIFKNFLSV